MSPAVSGPALSGPARSGPGRLRRAGAAAAGALALLAATGPGAQEAPPDLLPSREAPKPDREDAGPPPLPAAGRLLDAARRTREREGCAAAAPAYRVAAATGAGMEPAQHELGSCLLALSEEAGAPPREAALYRQEALFWLARAAHAGNARAQRELVTLHASPARSAHDPQAALEWALVYDDNPEADLYGFQALPRSLIEGLAADVGPEGAEAARAFAAEFAELPLSQYTPPPGSETRPRGEGPPPDGAARRRPPR